MPNTTQTADFWGFYLRHNNRVVWKDLQDAGVDLFLSGPNNNPQSFLDLTNILPAVNGGFNRRWGIQSVNDGVATSLAPIRTFIYNNPQDASDPSNTADTNLWIATDNQLFGTFVPDNTFYTHFGPSNFANPGNVQAAVSRSWFYYGNGVNPARKVNPSYIASNTDSLIGIAIPNSGGVTPDSYLNYPHVEFPSGTFSSLWKQATFGSSGTGYTSPPTVTISGDGTGATAVCQLGSDGDVTDISIVTNGSGYSFAQMSIAAPPAGGTQAYGVAYVQTNASAPNAGEVIQADVAGPMQFVGGRKYTVALQNSLTGHTSDVFTTDLPSAGLTGLSLDALTSSYSAAELAVGTTIPVYYGQSDANGFSAGFTQIVLDVYVPATPFIDPQVDTVILLATSDGGSIGTLYEVKVIPLSSFSTVSRFGKSYYHFHYIDTTPDSYTDGGIVPAVTLLEANLWAFTDPSGDIFGILLNTPPTPEGFLYPTQHQGRMFATDGKAVFFSKSLDEVTTSTGLITSKWEECWPGDYQLPVALNNEEIIGLKSDGTNLHIGTNKSLFTLYGSDPSNFSIPSVAFAQTGIFSNDCWSVIYAEGIPAGFVWITQDKKVMHSDFSTYREIGTQIYPILQTLDPAKINNAKIWALTQGPYNFAILQFSRVDTPNQPEFWIWETRLQRWYRWILPALETDPVGGSAAVTSSFVYQFPAFGALPSGVNSGDKFFYYWRSFSSGSQVLQARYFDPKAILDNVDGPLNIAWSIRTSWQDLGDPTAIKVVDEVEVTSDDTPLTVSLYGASSQAQFEAGGNLLKTGPTVQGPLSILDSKKFYTAGANTTAKYYSLAIESATPGTNPFVLSSFSLQAYPMARI